MRLGLVLGFCALATAAGAQSIQLSQPIDCTLGESCYIQHYRDNRAGAGTEDYGCGTNTYEDHSGTDFALPSLKSMDEGVNILAAYAGTVRAIRDGEPDGAYLAGARVSDKECGNGVVLDHEGGWQTQYCHLKRGSIRVKSGDRLTEGAVLGQVGLSGQSEFPHLHLTLRKNGVEIDPFRPSANARCDASAPQTLWRHTPPYRPAGLIAAGISVEPIPYAQIKEGVTDPKTLPVSSPQLLLWAYGWGARAGDELVYELKGPSGTVFQHVEKLTKNQALFYRYAGKKSRSPWPEGPYTATLTLSRNGKPLAEQRATLQLSSAP